MRNVLKIKKYDFKRVVTGPISKKYFLNKKYLGITEYLAEKTKCNNFAMLIYNKKLSVSPLTTHLPLQDVKKNISTKKIKMEIIFHMVFVSSQCLLLIMELLCTKDLFLILVLF